MKISLRPGEKIYINGAVVSVDRRVSLSLLNDATFLLESHVMQAAEATTPLREIYFEIQIMLMDPGSATELLPPVLGKLESISSIELQPMLARVGQLLRCRRMFDALRLAREIYRADEAAAPVSSEWQKEAKLCN